MIFKFMLEYDHKEYNFQLIVHQHVLEYIIIHQ